MTTSTKTQEDLALVQEIIGVDPLDFARRESGELVIILPDGRKLLLDPDQIVRALESGEYRVGAEPADAGGVGSPLPLAGEKTPPAPPKRGRGRPRKDVSA